MARHFVAALAALVLAAAPAAADEQPPDCTKTCAGQGVFNPALSDSPVTLVFCAVPQACTFTGPRG
jgi:hypothetical protein